MPDTNGSVFERIVALAGKNRVHAFRVLNEWQWHAWRLALEKQTAATPREVIESPKILKGRLISKERLAAAVSASLSIELADGAVERISNELFRHLERESLCWKTKYGDTVLSSRALEPVRFVRGLCAGFMSDEDIRYAVFSSIRNSCGCSLSSEIAHAFHSLSDAINRELIAPLREAGEKLGRIHRLSWNFFAEFLPVLQNAANKIGILPERQHKLMKALIGAARAVNYLQIDHRPECVVCLTNEIDAEFLISSLFGIPTRMRGFDQLFGGGLLLVEDIKDDSVERIRGRAILASGRYAAGKSLLALQVAVEVATKGGAAVILALEQPPEECLYTLQAMRLLPNDGSIDIAKTTFEATGLFSSDRDVSLNRGALVIVEADKSSYQEFLEILPGLSESMCKFPLRLIVVDPINAISKDDSPSVVALRSRTLSAFEKLKSSGTNVWFNAEDSPGSDATFFERNIADTVVHLTATEHHGHVQRYLEVEKSRLQREQRGKHPLEIRTGQGIVVFPSSAAVSERIRSRTPRTMQSGVRFGIDTLDAILGTNAINHGDVVVLQGPSGCFKTILGIHFLHADDRLKEITSNWAKLSPLQNILFATGDSELSLRWMAHEMFSNEVDLPVVSVHSLPDGYAHPGQILHEIERAIGGARYSNKVVDRIMVDNLSHWQLSCPFLRNDEIFGNTLVELLRRQDVTSILICAAPTSDTSRLQASVIENADCVIQFDSIPFQGKSQVMLRVIKSRDMNHRRDWFEVQGGSQSVSVRPIPSLLRVGPDGGVSRSPIRLFLYSETPMQRRYHDSLKKSIAAVVSRDVKIDSTASYNPSRSMLSNYSVLDELQVIELDEYQCPSDPKTEVILEVLSFDGSDTRLDWDDIIPRFTKRVNGVNGKLAVPYYANISVLAHRADLDRSSFDSWHAIARTAEEYCKSDPQALFFDFVKTTDEDYNCFFLEVLLSLCQQSEGLDLVELLGTPEAVEAMQLFRSLARRAHLAGRPTRTRDTTVKCTNAPVSRHWYTTINQMLSELTADERAKIRVTCLPGRVSIAGEWFLAVPSHSAAPELAMKLVAMMASREAESDRMRLGVGLPTRVSFYSDREADESLAAPVSPFFSMNLHLLRDLVMNSFRRSIFPGYVRIATELVAHLRRVLESERLSGPEAAQILHSLRSRISSRSNLGAERGKVPRE